MNYHCEKYECFAIMFFIGWQQWQILVVRTKGREWKSLGEPGRFVQPQEVEGMGFHALHAFKIGSISKPRPENHVRFPFFVTESS